MTVQVERHHMPAKHYIDEHNRLIVTTWHGEASDSELIEAIIEYQNKIKSHPDYVSYNEILDLSKVEGVALTTDGLKQLGRTASKTDHKEVTTRLAIIVQSSLLYGLARMYEAYRNLIPSSNKEIRIFKDEQAATKWVNGASL